MVSEIASAAVLFLLAVASLVIVLSTRARARGSSPFPKDRSDFVPEEGSDSFSFSLSDLEVIATFRSNDGFVENDLIKTVIFLGTLGIPASYHITHVGLVDPGERCYRLLVPRHHSQQARQRIQGQSEVIFS